MSATNRNGLERHEHDFYETPTWAIDAILDVLGIGPEWDGYAVDPGTGTGAIAHRIAERAPKADVRGIELVPELLEQAKTTRAASIAWENASWLTWTPDGTPDLIVANPPYQLTHWDPNKVVMKKGKDTGERGGIVIDDPNYAEKFIRKALEVAGKKGTVAMLLRENYFAPKTRRALRTLGLPDMHTLEKRPSFNGSGTDATDYSWFVWASKKGGRWDVIEIRGPESVAKTEPPKETAPAPTDDALKLPA